MKTTTQTDEREVHDKENCWWTGNRYVPISSLTDKHLKRAKIFAQREEELAFRRLCVLSQKIEKFDEEAERRNIKLPNRKSKFQKNQQVLKKSMKS